MLYSVMLREPDDYRMQTIEAVHYNSSLLQTTLGTLQMPKVQSKVYYPNITYKRHTVWGFQSTVCGNSDLLGCGSVSLGE